MGALGGIVASRVAEHFERPTILISLHRPDEPGQGSGRSFAGFDLHSGLKHCSQSVASFAEELMFKNCTGAQYLFHVLPNLR